MKRRKITRKQRKPSKRTLERYGEFLGDDGRGGRKYLYKNKRWDITAEGKVV